MVSNSSTMQAVRVLALLQLASLGQTVSLASDELFDIRERVEPTARTAQVDSRESPSHLDIDPERDVIAPTRQASTRQTLMGLRFKEVIRQDSDYSCGAATMATMMSYYFDDETSELEVLDALISGLDVEEQRNREYAGFSLLDMKMAAEQMGYRSAGYRLTLDQLRKLSAPVIVHVTPLGYKHFAVLRTIVGDRVFLADPSRGNLRMSVSRFLDEWSGVVFVMARSGEPDSGNSSFMHLSVRDKLPDKVRWQRQLERYSPGDVLPLLR